MRVGTAGGANNILNYFAYLVEDVVGLSARITPVVVDGHGSLVWLSMCVMPERCNSGQRSVVVPQAICWNLIIFGRICAPRHRTGCATHVFLLG